ncbi:MAG: Cna B-type domain-containing protein [Erysipelotrichaceae bacterium]|nr:Cna B-type domain-containing protein [Erysipelotrichaceae bacterium]
MQKKFFSKLIKSLLALTLVFGVVNWQGLITEVKADDPAPIGASKTLTDNGDGTYDLALSVTGASESSQQTKVDKANVVIVVDVSGSMDFNAGGGSTGTRLANTKTALNKLVDTLLANNKPGESGPDGTDLSDIIEISLIKFAFANETTGYNASNGTSLLISNAKTAGTATTNNTLKWYINNLWAGGGTNWERALATAKTEADRYKSTQPNESVSVIFLTDGVPTSWGTTNTAGQETRDNTHTGWNNASDDARGIVTGGYTLYNIFAYGTDTTKYRYDGNRTDADYLRSLTNYAYSGTGTYENTTLTARARPYFFNASNTAALEEAFKRIAESINNQVGYAGVDFVDGVTVGVTSTSVTVDGSVDTSKFLYEVKDENGNVVYTVKINGDNATFTVGGNTVTGTKKTVTMEIDPEQGETEYTYFEATVGDNVYKMAPASMGTNGLIDWQLAGIGILENGWTYTLHLEVWPNQFSYDIVADLNNKVKTLEQIKAEVIRNQGQAVWDQIEAALIGPDASGKYSIRTNYQQYVDYYKADETVNETTGETEVTYTPQPRKELTSPTPLALTSSEMRMLKLWDDSLDENELKELLWKDYTAENPSDPTGYQVTLRVWKADTKDELEDLVDANVDGTEYLKKTLGWDATRGEEGTGAYVWEKKLDVAPGTMLTIEKAQEMGIDTTLPEHAKNIVTYEGKEYYILESGHYYYVTEDNIDRHFELNTIVYHPMLVNGVLSNVTFNDDGTVEKIEPMSTVDATNTLKGGINVLKRAFDEDAEILASEDIFTVKITLKNADGTPYEDWDYRVYYGANNPLGEWDEENQNYGRSGHNYGSAAPGNGGIITAELYIGDVIRIVNVPAGVTYVVEETKVNDTALDSTGSADGYTYNKIEYEISRGAADKFVADTANADGTYTVHGNSASQATVYNKVPSYKVVVVKTGTYENTTALSGVKFKLYSDAEATKQITKDSLGKDVGDADNENILTSGSDGKISLGTFIPGTYYLKEVETVTGYKLLETITPIEITVDGTTDTVTVTIKNEEVTEYEVVKEWNDNNSTTRPTSITVTLYQGEGDDKVAYGNPVTLNAENEWHYKWTGLPKYDADGELIVYSAEETVPNGYLPTTEEGENTVTITNTETTEATVIKVWDDADNQDGIRPASLEVTLSNGDKVTLNEGNKWTATISNLPKYDSTGAEITYSWTEGTLPEGYTFNGSSKNGTITTITNTHITDTTERTVVKVWDDNDDQDGIRPEELTVKLMNGQTTVRTVTLTEADVDEDGNWTKTVDKLPVNEVVNGKSTPITYTWVEDETGLPEGYELTDTEEEGLITTLTNSYTPQETKVTVTKTWADNKNQDGKRPTTATVQLYAQPEGGEKKAVGDPVTVGTAEDWSKEWDKLPVYENGKKITYSVEETLPDNTYTKSGDDKTLPAKETDSGTIAITNSYTPEVQDLTVIKKWNDNENQDGKRPESIKVTLKANGEIAKDADGKDIVVTLEGTEWTATVKGLPVYANGSKITYTWVEEDLTEKEYSIESQETVELVTIITNKHTPDETSATVKKVWEDKDNQDGIRPTELTVALLANDDPYLDAEDKPVTVTLTEANSWTATVTGLPKNANGEPIKYTWDEGTAPTGYTLTGNSTEGTITTLTNTHTPAETEATVKKVWDDKDNQDGIRPTELKVTLSNGTEVTLNEGNSWSATVDKLPKYNKGVEIEYTWTEGTLPEGYKLTNTSKEGTVTTLTNSHTPEVIDITVEKVWNDNDNNDGKRSTEITVSLKADGTGIRTLTLNEGNEWKQTVTGLPKYKEGAVGQEIKYTLEEMKVVDYTTTYSEIVDGKITITNTHEDELIDISVKKVWIDENNKYGVRPASIEVILKADGEKVDSVTLTDEKLEHTFKDLNVYADGKKITYTVEEVMPENTFGYSSKMTGGQESGYVFTNTYKPIEFDPPVIKDITGDKTSTTDEFTFEFEAVTEGAPMPEGSEGNKKTISIPGDGTAYEFGPVTITTIGKYEYVIREVAGTDYHYQYDNTEYHLLFDVDVNAENELVCQLTVSDGDTETIIPWQQLKEFPFVFVNKYHDYIDLEIVKVWDDGNDAQKLRPEEIEITVLANDEEMITVVLSEENDWSVTISPLPCTDENFKEITYSVVEKNVPKGYTVSYSQKEYKFTVTNTVTPPETSDASGISMWLAMFGLSVTNSLGLAYVSVKRKKEEQF